MAAKEQRSNKEKKKPKADKNKQKGGLAPHLQRQQGGGTPVSSR
jgi:hypothetical protein